MKLTWVLFLSTALAAAPEAAPEATAAPTATSAPPSTTDAGTTNWSSLGQALKSLSLPMPSINPTAVHMGNISPPPPSLVNQIITAVPPSALLEIINPTKRRTLAEQIRAGSTPAWYSSLPPDVRGYMGVIRSQVQQGALTQPATTASSTGGSEGSGSGGATATATGTAAGASTGTGSSETNAANSGGDRILGLGLGLVEMVAMGVAMVL